MTDDPIVLEVEDVLTDPRLTAQDLDLFRLEVLAICRQTRGLLRRARGRFASVLRCPECDCEHNHLTGFHAVGRDMQVFFACENGHEWTLRLHEARGLARLSLELRGRRDTVEIPEVFLG